jgi:chromosome condensin MukBEF MukE localization factor
MYRIPGDDHWQLACHFEDYLAAFFERYVAEPVRAPPTWRAADPLSRPTIMLSGLAPSAERGHPN